MAEYETCIVGLHLALDMDMRNLHVIGDSDLLIHQIREQWATKIEKIIPYVGLVQRLADQFQEVKFKHIPRTQNEFANDLATIASMVQHPDSKYIDPIRVEIRGQRAHYAFVEAEIDGKPWYVDIKMYLEKGEYPEGITINQKKTITKLANGFFLNKNVLYKRTLDLGLLRYVDFVEATRLIEEVHVGICYPHMNGFVLAKKILRIGYYWMTMENDCSKFIHKCQKCQIHGDLIKVPPTKLDVVTSPWLFTSWGMDVIGPIEPAVSNKHHFILVAIDYFTNHLMKEIYAQFRITHRNSTVYRPQMNGAIEAANKNIKKILRKMIDNNKDWHKQLPHALLGYRITARTSMGTTPYMPVYGTEAVIPAEVEIPSLRIIQETELDDAEWICKRHEQLAFLDEKRMIAVCHGLLYQQRMA
ncbi:uncharacterized protein LOC132644056 [Lycium barbarum]|uniref:uncharacterized protein LOC132644056 n=1 Tax=Lycium barbarum TaxID=112863 RepID=UPI00293ED43B|nr:uncharacterized protein LOC132644056 [Lycium barbarum]